LEIEIGLRVVDLRMAKREPHTRMAQAALQIQSVEIQTFPGLDVALRSAEEVTALVEEVSTPGCGDCRTSRSHCTSQRCHRCCVGPIRWIGELGSKGRPEAMDRMVRVLTVLANVNAP
jgi:hypothetical protein